MGDDSNEVSFELDRFQRDAIASIDEGRSVLVSAPTGSGKTVVAEHAVARAVGQGRKAFYTTPIKALSNQKFHDLCAIHGNDRVGLLTGDNSVAPDAQIVVMTTEVLRNMLYAGSATLEGLGCVVLDEVHYLQDPYRGAVWEEVIIHTAPDVQFVCLSATVSNAGELAAWMTSARGATDTVIETKRPVELDQHYFVGDKDHDELVDLPTLVDGRPNPEGSKFDSDLHGPNRGGRGRRRWFTPRRVDVVRRLATDGRLPGVYFVFSRAGCDEAAAAVLDAGVRLTSTSEAARISSIVDRHVAGISEEDLEVLGFRRFAAALEIGAASHHAGQVPPFKAAVEECFVQGLVKVVFATETLAMGINMPAKSVVLDTLSRFRGDGHTALTPGEFTQLTGRAGRRGLDPIGHAVVLWSPFVGFDQVAALATSTEFELRSAFRPTYNMVVNLVAGHSPDAARALLERSFAQFQSASTLAALNAERSRKRAELRGVRSARASRRDPVRIDRLTAELEGIERRIARHRDSLADRFSRMLDVLETWEFLDGWQLTDRGTRLRSIYHECDVLIAIALADGVFDDLGPHDVAALASLFTYEHRSKNPAPAPWYPTRELRARATRVAELHRTLVKDEERADLEATRETDPTLLPLAHAWASGHELHMVLADEELSAGDFVRNIRQLIDLCGQIGKAAPVAATRAAARDAAEALRHGIVASAEVDADEDGAGEDA